MKVTLRQLRYLDALATEGHFGRAAERVSVSQPALSAQIRDLEAALGLHLVERTATGGRLTAAGEEIVARARRIIADVNELEASARARQGALAGPLRLGVIPSVAPFILPDVLSAAAAAYPDLRLVVRETVTATLQAELAAGTVDVVLASLPLDPDQFEEVALVIDAFALALPRNGPYALTRVEMAADIPPEALLLLEDGHCLRDQTLAVCGSIDARRLRSSGVTSLATIVQLVAAGHGVSLLPAICLASLGLDEARVRLHRLPDSPQRTIGLAWRRTSPIRGDLLRFSDVVRAAIEGGALQRASGFVSPAMSSAVMAEPSPLQP